MAGRILKAGTYGDVPAGARRVLKAGTYEDAQEPGYAESATRGALQGATLGYSDEIAGGIEAGTRSALRFFGSDIEDKTYQQARDEARAKNERAQKANPWTYGIGEVGGGVATALVPGLGVAKGAGLGLNIVKGAGLGAAAGFGTSTAPIVADKEGNTDLGRAATDVAIGAGLGGAVSLAAPVVGKVAGKVWETAKRAYRGAGEASKQSARNAAIEALWAADGQGEAAERAAAREYAATAAQDKAGRSVANASEDGAVAVAREEKAKAAFASLVASLPNGSKRNKLSTVTKAVHSELVRNPELASAVKGNRETVEEAARLASEVREQIGSRMNELVDTAAPGASATAADVAASLQKVADKINPVVKDTAGVRKGVEEQIADIQAHYKVDGKIPLRELWDMKSKFQEGGYGGAAKFSERVEIEAKRRMADAVAEIYHREVKAGLGRMPDGKELIKEYEVLNKRYGAAASLHDLLEEKLRNVKVAAQTQGEIAADALERGAWDRKATTAAGMAARGGTEERPIGAATEAVIGGATTPISTVKTGLTKGAGWGAEETNLAIRKKMSRQSSDTARSEMESALREVDALTPGSTPVATAANLQRLMSDPEAYREALSPLVEAGRALSRGGSTDDLLRRAEDAVRAGVPRGAVEELVRRYLDRAGEKKR